MHLVHRRSGVLDGAGLFPAEQDNDIGQYIRDRGNEYGTTTGRPRRCGWFDAFATRFGIPVAESQAGKGALPWNHPMNVGPVGAAASVPVWHWRQSAVICSLPPPPWQLAQPIPFAT